MAELSKMNRKNSTLIFLLSYQLALFAGEACRISLDNLTQDDDGSFHITFLQPDPKTKLFLPEIDSGTPKFFDLFYTSDEKPDPSIDVMCVQNSNYDALYVDYNNDEDLTNDGPALIFQNRENSIEFDIASKHDESQKARLLLSRKPIVPDSLLSAYVDEAGNMIPEYAKVCGAMKGDFNFKGEKGSFYFDDRVSLRRGVFECNEGSIAIGLFDKNNNGCFNDPDDLLYLDLNGDGRLYSFENEFEVFKLTDVFSIHDQNYKIGGISKDGKWLDLEMTEERETFYYFQEAAQAVQKVGMPWAVTAKLDSSFWELAFSDIDGNTIKMSEKRGKNILLNFWGEWCSPCVHEIPELVKTSQELSSEKFEIISFVNTSRLDLVKKIVAEKQMHWPQILLSNDMKEQFRVFGYPTNILILKDGKTYLHAASVNFEFLASHIK